MVGLLVEVGELPADVRAFIRAHIGALDPLEILLLLHTRRGAALAAAEVARELRLDVGHSSKCLEELAARGFLATEPQGYRWAPASVELDRGFEALAKAYTERRVAVITAIFSGGSDRVQLFADAFRIRKDR